MNIGDAIKTLRKQRKMTQEQLALEADIATSNVSRIEKGLRQPSQKLLLKLAKALDSKPSILYAACEPPNTEPFEIEITTQVDLTLNTNSQTLLELFDDLTPDNQHLLLEQAKTLHRWQVRYKPID